LALAGEQRAELDLLEAMLEQALESAFDSM
jgi:hypothetical protein